MELQSHAWCLCLALLFLVLTFALPPGFDSDTLPFLATGYRSLKLGAVCASTSQCPRETCCLNRGPGGPTCRHAARLGRGCSPLTYRNIYFGFCPCVAQATCHRWRRTCE
ncbi:hypothetical protein MTO96_035055 [Rhipicephalus appendiculatus]